MSNSNDIFTTAITLEKIRPSVLDKIFELAEIEIEVEIKYSFYGGCHATYTQPEEYPEASYCGFKITDVRIYPIDEEKNLEHFVLLNVLNDEIKKEIEVFTEEYIHKNWSKGNNIESEILDKVDEEHRSYIEGWADVEQDYD